MPDNILTVPQRRIHDIATGTGFSAEAALAAVGPTEHVEAADISPAMAAKASEAVWTRLRMFRCRWRTDRGFLSRMRVSMRCCAN
jgi:ubiquinone/menaquinone biosynthesis C-methylase UbiE